MGIIKQLSLQEIHKIAAGEVVERPASVVKELVENALDAQATTVSIYIDNEETLNIRVIDNGVGMAADDARICFEHHATSKLESFEQLYQLDTFGFRGEALTSIAAVSKVILVTKQKNDLIGTQIVRINGVNQLSEISCQTGTDIFIQDLFYNVPARKKFLKTVQTEWRHILNLFQAFCLDYPHIHFKLFLNNQMQYNCPISNNLQDRILQLFDHSLASSMIPIDQIKTPDFAIEGMISNYQTYRYDRSSIFFFVNKRFIKNSSLAKALIKGYLNIIPPDRFPAAIVHITIDPAQIDINVHPRKEEIAFAQARTLENALQKMVKETLSAHVSLPKNNFLKVTSYQPAQSSPAPHLFESLSTAPEFTPSHAWAVDTQQASVKINPIQQTHPHEQQNNAELVNQSISQQPVYQKPEIIHLIGYYADTYLLADHEKGLMIIDQHAAHERILYQEFKQRFGNPTTIQLLFPEFIECSKEYVKIAVEYKDTFAQHGIILDQLSDHHIAVKEITTHLKNSSRTELVKDIIGLIIENSHLSKDDFFKLVHEKIHAQMACKAAVKAGDRLSLDEQQKLIDQLEECENNIACPHGRPIRWLLNKHEIEVKFKRKT